MIPRTHVKNKKAGHSNSSVREAVTGGVLWFAGKPIWPNQQVSSKARDPVSKTKVNPSPKADLWLYMHMHLDTHRHLPPPAIHKGKGTDKLIHINIHTTQRELTLTRKQSMHEKIIILI